MKTSANAKAKLYFPHKKLGVTPHAPPFNNIVYRKTNQNGKILSVKA